MSSINAAFALAQLEKINFFLKNKLNLFNKYKYKIDKIKGLSISDTPDYAINNHWLNILNINKKIYGKTINSFI
jgi:dTDP-4-amino-4,6-dideoxygalactose transaminase|tara:strand:+ start:474 stop:695 length:222 start_codon:yes stop_codon:yes gene_type:complete